jgi:uroporphyrinogen-III decarboxylase
MEITHKQRIMAAIKKQPVDKLPSGVRIDQWYNYHSTRDTLPDKYKGRSMLDINRDLGVGTQLRLLTIWNEEFRGMEIVTEEEFPFTTTRYKTPFGTVSQRIKFNPAEGAMRGYIVEPLFKSEDDYLAVEYLIEHTTLVLDLTDFVRLSNEGGEDAAIAVGDASGPMQKIMKDYMGYQKFVYELYDNPRKVEHLHEVIKEQWALKLETLVASPVELPVLCGNWSDDLHTPLFRKCFVPWLQEATDYLHAHGKIAMVHTDGEMRRLIPFILDTGIDVAECWSPAPMTSITTAELKEAWGDKITIWGGVASQLFRPNYSDEEFDDYVIQLFREVAPGNNFIVGMGENFPFDGKIERVRRIAELIDEYGTLPIHI